MTTRKYVAVLAAAAAIAVSGFVTPATAEVTLIYSDWQLAEPLWGRSLKEAFAEFEKLNPDIKIKTEAKAAFNYVIELINTDKVMPPGVTQVDANGGRQLVASRKVAMAFEGLFTVPIIADMNPNTENPEAAWKLIRFIMEKKQMEKWFADNNLLSARKSVNDGCKAIADNRFATAARGEMDRAAILPQFPQWPEIQETFRQALQSAIAKSKTPEQALADAHASIEAILARP